MTINVARPAVNEKTDSYKAAVDSHAPIACWRLDDEASGSTSTATDETGSHNGTHHDADYLPGGPFGGAGADTLNGGGGDNRLYGGAGGGWTDTIHVDGAAPGSHGSDWTVNLTSGTINATGGNYLDLSDDAAGTITLQDGSQVSFEGIERIEW